MTRSELKRMFVHGPLRPEQIELLNEFATMFLHLGGRIVANTTECAETTTALCKLQECQQYVCLAVTKTEVAPEQATEINKAVSRG